VARQAFSLLKEGIRINAHLPGPDRTRSPRRTRICGSASVRTIGARVGVEASTPLEQAYPSCLMQRRRRCDHRHHHDHRRRLHQLGDHRLVPARRSGRPVPARPDVGVGARPPPRRCAVWRARAPDRRWTRADRHLVSHRWRTHGHDSKPGPGPGERHVFRDLVGRLSIGGRAPRLGPHRRRDARSREPGTCAFRYSQSGPTRSPVSSRSTRSPHGSGHPRADIHLFVRHRARASSTESGGS